MLPRLFAIAMLAIAGSTFAQSLAPAPPAAGSDDDKFLQIIGEIQQLHGKNKFTEALDKLHEAEKLKPESPVLYNVRGSVFTGMRDFDKAREAFAKAQSLSPEAFEPKFNLIELDYVTGKYAEAEAGFAKVLNDFPKLPMQVRHLTQAKVIICQLKQSKLAEAETGAKTFTYMDDTPAYYFVKAAFAFQKGDKADAADWLAKAGKIYKAEDNAPYLDSLMEARWIPSLSVPDQLGK
ncbi:MAG: tetratricopeptide repeat protein [Roseimicrobium sp.]